MHNAVVQARTLALVSHCVGAAVRNVTVSMHIHMLMVVEHHIDVTQLDSLHSLIVDHVSSWLLVEPHYVTVVKVQLLQYPSALGNWFEKNYVLRFDKSEKP